MKRTKIIRKFAGLSFPRYVLKVDDFLLNLPSFDCMTPFNNPRYTFEQSVCLTVEKDLEIDNWRFPTFLQAVKIQVSWFEILTLAYDAIPFQLRWDRSDNPIWIWTCETQHNLNWAIDINSGDRKLCEANKMKAYSFLVKTMNEI